MHKSVFKFYSSSFFLFSLILLLFWEISGCGSSMNLPSIEESQKSINIYKSRLDSLDSINIFKKITFPEGNDFVTRINVSILNRILEALANKRNNDITVNFLPTHPLFSEDKSILGISYTNYLNIDNGFVNTNLKKFRFDKFDYNRVYATLEVEGTGNISVSGKYIGIPASVSPQVDLYLYESIMLDVVPTDSGYIVFKPQPQKLILKTKFSVKLLQWQVPWYQEVPLELTDILKPIAIPITLKPEIQFPLPAKKFGDQKVEFASYILDISHVSVSLSNNIMEFRSNIDFKQKK